MSRTEMSSDLEVLTVLVRGLRPRTPSSSGSLALARPTGQEIN